MLLSGFETVEVDSISNPQPDIIIQRGRKVEKREGMARKWLFYSGFTISTRRYLWLTVWYNPKVEFSAVMDAVSGAYKHFTRQYPINTDEAFLGKKAPE